MPSDYLDYENNLAFEPKMTWEDLVKFALAKGWFYMDDFCVYKDKLGIGKDGSLYSMDKMKSKALTPPTLKPEQMKTIIENLSGE